MSRKTTILAMSVEWTIKIGMPFPMVTLFDTEIANGVVAGSLVMSCFPTNRTGLLGIREKADLVLAIFTETNIENLRSFGKSLPFLRRTHLVPDFPAFTAFVDHD
jgi:hypothetical protein